MDILVNTPLIIAAGGSGANSEYFGKLDGIDGLVYSSENKNDDNYNNVLIQRSNCNVNSNGRAGRGASFKNDFDMFKSYVDKGEFTDDYNQCNPKSLTEGAIGGTRYQCNKNLYRCNGGFGGGGGSWVEGGAGGGYIGGCIIPQNQENIDSINQAALSYNQCDSEIEAISKKNDGDGKVDIDGCTVGAHHQNLQH